MLGDLVRGKIAPAAQLELVEAAAKHPSQEVQAALKSYQDGLPKNDPLAAYRVALEGGDKAAGEILFRESVAAGCLRCHKVNGAGGEAGPDLTGVATRKDRNYFLESIIVPNAQIAEGFRMLVLSMKNGDIQAGMVKKETDQEMVLQLPGAPAVTVKKADIVKTDSAPSGMPPNLSELITKREIRDIVEYLSSLNEK
jgi:quinoprotein glucose dehydrogenase